MSMTPYVVRDSSGNVLRTGQCESRDVDLQARPGSGQTVTRGVEPGVTTPSRVLARHTVARIYPPLGDQLDAIWKTLAANPGLLDANAADMLAQILAVKAAHPATTLYVKNSDGTYSPYTPEAP